MAYGSSSYGSESYGGISGIAPTGTINFFLSGYLLKAAIIKTFTIDVKLVLQNSKTLNINAILVQRNLKALLFDAALQETFSKTFTLNARLLKHDNLKTFSIDSKLIIRKEKTFTIDSINQKTNIETFNLTARIYTKKAWMLPWKYRKLKILNGVSTDEANYQIKFKVFYGSGIDTSNTVYCNNKCNSNFSDLRFTKSDGTTLLNYWIQEFVDLDYCIVWVKIDILKAGNNSTNIYMYYGNSTAIDIGSITNTMIFGDNFEGTTANFTTTSGVSIFNNKLKITTPGTGTGSFFGIKSNTTFKKSILGNFALELCGIDYLDGSIEDTIFFGLCDNAVSVSASLVDVVNRKAGYIQEEYIPARNHSYETSDGTTISEHNVNRVDWTSKRYLSESWLGDSSEFFVDDISQVNVANGINDSSNLSIFMSIEDDVNSFYPEEILVDSIFVRKFIPGIPNMGNWGNEEIISISPHIIRTHRMGLHIYNG